MIYRARHILPMDGSVIENGEILVRGDRIAALGHNLAESHPNEKVRDLGKAVMLPGFVNAHCHLEYTLTRNRWDGLNLWEWIERAGYRHGRKPDQSLLEAAAIIGAVELARSGVTCVADSSFSGAAVPALKAVGLRGTVYLEIFGQSAGDNYAEEFQRRLDHARELQFASGPNLSIGISPHAIYTSNRGLLELCAKAGAELDMPVAMHLAETRAEIDYALRGAGAIADFRRGLGYEPMLSGALPALYLREVGLLKPGVCLAHCVHLSDEEIELVGRSGAGIAHCPRSNAFLGAGVAPVRQLLAMGARVGLGTDGLGTCLTFDFFEEMRFAMAIHRAVAEDAGAMTAKDVLRQATVGGAEAIGAADQIGSLEVGKRADVIAVDASSMLGGEDVHLAVVAKSPGDVVLVLVGGETVAENGSPVRVDLRECRDRIEKGLEL